VIISDKQEYVFPPVHGAPNLGKTQCVTPFIDLYRLTPSLCSDHPLWLITPNGFPGENTMLLVPCGHQEEEDVAGGPAPG
jgi:hypothetical protein